MIRVCVSNFHVGDRVFGEKEPLVDHSQTHGFCNPCFEKEMIMFMIRSKEKHDGRKEIHK